MNIWLAISLVLAVAAVYLLSIEIFSVAFKLTGLATNKIKFQVASLFTSTGYTTAESELVAKDEKRRKIATACIYTGHIFSVAFMGLIINVVISLSLAMYKPAETPEFTEWYFIILYITLGLFALVLFLKIRPVNRRFQRLLEIVAIHASRKNKNSNIITILDTQGKYAIVELVLNNVPAFANEVPLQEMGLTKRYSINILSIRRDSRVVEVTKDTMFRKGDILVIYGLLNDIKDAFVGSVNKQKQQIVIDKTNEITLVNNYGSVALVEVYVDEVPKELDGIKLANAHLKDKFDITIAFIQRKGSYGVVDKDTIIEKGDVVSMFGPYQNIKLLFKNDENE